MRGSGERKTGLITLNRPKQLNALNDRLMDELGAALKAFDADDGIGCIVLTGSEKAFAAGADIARWRSMNFTDAYKGDFITRNWETIRTVRKPVIAAVAGFALGGGCELAMMCDFIIAADTRKVRPARDQDRHHPGRRRHAAAAARGRQVEGDGHGPDGPHDGRGRGRACRAGVARRSRCRAAGRWRWRRPRRSASSAAPSVMMAKESVNRAFEGPLSDGIMFERRLFHSLFATEDQKEGMDAFLDKRKAEFKQR